MGADGARLWLSGPQWEATLAKLEHVSKALGWVRVSLVHYAGVEHLTTTLRSLQAQSLDDWRAVVVNDGSTDKGPAIARALAGGEPRIRVIDQPNRGLSGARNRGIDAIDAERLMFLDADDLLFPHALERLVGAMDATGLPGAACGYEFLDERAHPIGRQTAATLPTVGLDELLDWNRFVVHSQLIRAGALAGQRFDESLTSGEDYDLWLRLAERGVRWAGVDRFLVGYRIRAGSMSKDFRRMAANESAIIRGSFDRLADADARPDTPDSSDERRACALTRSALAYASRLAIGAGEGDTEAALVLLGELRLDHAITPGDAATAAIFAIQFGAAAAPEIIVDAPARWVPAVDRWWRGLGRRGWTIPPNPQSFVGATLDAFASRALHPRDVAGACVRRAISEGVRIVAPFDARARWIGRVAPEGLSTVYAGPGAERLLAGGRHDAGPRSSWVESPEAARADARTLVVTTPDDAPDDAISWDDAHRDLAGEARARLASAWIDHAPARDDSGAAALTRSNP